MKQHLTARNLQTLQDAYRENDAIQRRQQAQRLGAIAEYNPNLMDNQSHQGKKGLDESNPKICTESARREEQDDSLCQKSSTTAAPKDILQHPQLSQAVHQNETNKPVQTDVSGAEQAKNTQIELQIEPDQSTNDTEATETNDGAKERYEKTKESQRRLQQEQAEWTRQARQDDEERQRTELEKAGKYRKHENEQPTNQRITRKTAREAQKRQVDPQERQHQQESERQNQQEPERQQQQDSQEVSAIEDDQPEVNENQEDTPMNRMMEMTWNPGSTNQLI